jgi:phosphoenolpyruvate-protein phosphotransferase
MAIATLAGQPGSPGIGVGRLLWVESEESTASRAGNSVAAAVEPEAERTRLLAALAAAAAELEALAEQTTVRAGEEVGAIFAAQALFATDPGIVEPALALVAGGAAAAEAIDRVTTEQADNLAAVDDDYFRERAADVRDIGRRVVDRLLGRTRPVLHHADGTSAVLAGDDFDPSVVAVIRPELVAGIALSGGAPTGHAAIVARALGVPLVLGLGSALDATLDRLDVAVDGSSGRLLVAPDADDLKALRSGDREPATADAGPTRVSAKLPVVLAANVGSVREAEAAAEAGAEGIGLVRTELLFLGRSSPPGLDEQRSLYRRIADTLSGRPVVFRTLDIGGDKPAPYLTRDPEMNPALGVRGLRLGFAQPELLETQFRALLEAKPDAPLRVMLPMVATVEEVVAARAALDAAAAASRGAGREVSSNVQLGIMVEIPSVAILADAFAPVVDFFSIGTNDLVQYALAVDRTNPTLAGLATALQPAVLRLIRDVVAAARPFERHVAVCGEAASDPAMAALLVGLGVDELSMAPASLPVIGGVLGGLDVDACRAAAAEALQATTVADVKRITASLLARSAAA